VLPVVLGARELEGQPGGALALLVRDGVDERGQHPGEALVVAAAVTNGTEREAHTALARVDLERDLCPIGGVERAEDGELEVVHARVGEVRP
jgi:hypothetical protein